MHVNLRFVHYYFVVDCMLSAAYVYISNVAFVRSPVGGVGGNDGGDAFKGCIAEARVLNMLLSPHSAKQSAVPGSYLLVS